MSDGLSPNLTRQSVASLPARDNIPLLALLEHELSNGSVSPLSHCTASTVQVELSTELCSRGTMHPNKPIRFYVKKGANRTCRRLT